MLYLFSEQQKVAVAASRKTSSMVKLFRMRDTEQMW
jgi:hypothetical protein